MNTLVSNNPPGHRNYRLLLDKVFTQKKVAGVEPRIQEIIDELIDAFADESEIDFLQAFAIPLPMNVIAEQLGVTREDRADFKRWSNVAQESMDPTLMPQRQVELARGFVDMQQYMARAIERVRATPDDRLLSRLANTETEGRLLEVWELQSLILQILVAGNETTTTTLASGMLILLQRPELAEEIRANPDLVRPHRGDAGCGSAAPGLPASALQRKRLFLAESWWRDALLRAGARDWRLPARIAASPASEWTGQGARSARVAAPQAPLTRPPGSGSFGGRVGSPGRVGSDDGVRGWAGKRSFRVVDGDDRRDGEQGVGEEAARLT